MNMQRVLVLTIAASLCAEAAHAQTFLPTGETADWNVDANWSSAPFPNSSGALTALPAPITNLTVNLNQPITVGALTINKGSSGAFNTTIQGSQTNTLTFSGGTSLTNAAPAGAAGTGATIIEAPINFTAGLTITQNDADGLRLMQPVGGAGGLTFIRGTSGSGVVALSNANTYTGTTLIKGNASTDFMLVRLNNATSIPGGIGTTGGTSNITFNTSAVLGLRADDFKRSIGIGPEQFQFTTPNQSGWAAFTENRAVNIGGAGALVAWNATGFNPGTLVLGHSTADKTIDFQNTLSLLTSGTSSPTRSVRIADGSAAIDARFSGGITSPATGSNSLSFIGNGTVSLDGASSYNGITTINSTVVIMNHADALAPGNLTLTNTGVIGLGAGDFTRTLGTGAGQVQFILTSGNGGGGFAAYGANRIVNIGGNSTPQQLTWGTGNFVPNSGSNLLLAFENSDATVDFQNPIDLNGAIATGPRTFAVRDGSANIDGKVSGVISGMNSVGIIKGQAGTLELTANNTYTGDTTIQNGVLLLKSANSIPGGITGGNVANIVFTNSGSLIGLGAGDFTSDVGFGAGKVQFSPANNHGFAAYGANRAVNLGGASAQVTWNVNSFIGGNFLISAAGADGTLDFQNPIDLHNAVRTLDVRNGTAAVDGLLSGALSGSGGIQKIGAGTLKLTAENTYDGVTTVTNGRLLVNNTTGSGAGTSTVTVTGGTLGGTGSISGVVTVNTGGHIAPGDGVGTFTVGSLTLNTGALLDFELGAPGSPGIASDLLNITTADGLNLAGGAVTLADAGGLALGTYTLIDYAGTLAGDVANLGIPTGPNGFIYSLVNNVANTSIDLTVAATPVGLPGDYNADGIVDGGDYVVWRKNNGILTGATVAQGDADGDVDADDLAFWRARYGNTLGPGSGSGTLGGGPSVPEPASLALLGTLAALLAIPCRRSRA